MVPVDYSADLGATIRSVEENSAAVDRGSYFSSSSRREQIKDYSQYAVFAITILGTIAAITSYAILKNKGYSKLIQSIPGITTIGTFITVGIGYVFVRSRVNNIDKRFQKDNRETTELVEAIRKNSLLGMKWALSWGADSHNDVNGKIPLQHAADAYNVEAVKVLISYGAGFSAENNSRQTAAVYIRTLVPENEAQQKALYEMKRIVRLDLLPV